jgi:hypothetical protein
LVQEVLEVLLVGPQELTVQHQFFLLLPPKAAVAADHIHRRVQPAAIRVVLVVVEEVAAFLRRAPAVLELVGKALLVDLEINLLNMALAAAEVQAQLEQMVRLQPLVAAVRAHHLQ